MADENTIVSDKEVKDQDTLVGAGEDDEQANDQAEKDSAKDQEQEGKSSEKEGSDDGKSEDGEDSDKDKNEGAPDKYEGFELPEGMEVDQELMETAQETFKELNLTQEQAQKLVSMQADALKKEYDAQRDAWSQTMEDWQKSSKDDKEFGGKEFDANVAVAKEAVKAYGTDEFKEMLNMTGVGNHPEMVRFLYRVGKTIKDDEMHQGNRDTTVPKDPARILYPSMQK